MVHMSARVLGSWNYPGTLTTSGRTDLEAQRQSVAVHSPSAADESVR